jgi:hypothetical protein
MTGVWPGDKRNVGRRGSANPSIFNYTLLSTDDVITYSALLAGAQTQLDDDPPPADVTDVPTVLSGARFRIPVLAPVGVKSGDGRSFGPLALSHRQLPIPLMWQIQTQDGHDASVIVGRIDSIERAENGSLVNARGVFDVGPYGQESERLVRHKFLRGVSVDLDQFEATARPAVVDEADDDELSDDTTENRGIKIAPDEMLITNGRAMAATLVAKPAFEECTIELDDDLEDEMVADGTYIATPEQESEAESFIRAALTAAGIPVHPPREWFEDPKLTTKTPLTVDDDGRVYGHIATWDVDHIGLPFSTRPPRSRSHYSYFHTGMLRTQEGVDVPVGQITLAGGHAPLEANAAAAVQHYDNTASAFCDVQAGEDAHGIWVAGGLRPSVTAEQVRAVRASAPSGDWRPINGRLELVAVCQVNVPGFPVTRARVASGQVFALVAAGTATLSRIRGEQTTAGLDHLLERVEALESPQRQALASARDAALSKVNAVRQEKAATARERFASVKDQPFDVFRDYSPEKRDEYTKKGWALDGAYPIANVSDLKNAIRAYGRAAAGDRTKVRRHIKKRARALGKTDLIPDSWKEASIESADLTADVEEIQTRFALLATGGRYPDGSPWEPGNHPRDEKGKFRQVIAEIKDDLEEEVGTAEAVQGIEEIQAAERRGDIDAAQQAARNVLDLVDKLAGETADGDLVNTLREGYGNLAEAVANLPLAFGDLNQKYRFTDLPDDIRSLIEDLYARADAKLAPEHLEEAGGKLAEFMAGGDVLSQPQISAELSRILRFLI